MNRLIDLEDISSFRIYLIWPFFKYLWQTYWSGNTTQIMPFSGLGKAEEDFIQSTAEIHHHIPIENKRQKGFHSSTQDQHLHYFIHLLYDPSDNIYTPSLHDPCDTRSHCHWRNDRWRHHCGVTIFRGSNDDEEVSRSMELEKVGK